MELSIGGMTCASCAARVEKKLNKLDGVAATVHFAPETARVTVGSPVSIDVSTAEPPDTTTSSAACRWPGAAAARSGSGGTRQRAGG